MTTHDTTMTLTDARTNLSTLHKRFSAGNSFFFIKKHNRDLFAVVDPDYLRALIETMEILEDPKAYEMLMESIEDIKRGRVRDHQDVRRDILGE